MTRVTHFNLIPNSITFGNDPVISDAGTEVVGMNGITSAPFYWSEAHGYEDLPIIDPAGMYLANGFPIYGTGGGGLSSDGSTVVGHYQNFDGSTMQLYYWRHGAGATTIPTPSPYTRAFAVGCNSDGTIIAGYMLDDTNLNGDGQPHTVSFIWNGSFTILPAYSSHWVNQLTVFSDDGTTLAGNSYGSPDGTTSFAWVWTFGTGYVLVPPPVGTDTVGFTAISNDGNSICGSTGNIVHGFVWTRAGGLVDVGVLPAHVGPYAESQLFDISDDGSKAVGMSIDGSSNSLAVLWDGSTLTSLGYLVLNGSENTDTQATSISGDGTTVAVVGTTSDFANQQQPMTWTSGDGLVDLVAETTVGSVTTGPFCDWNHGYIQFRTGMSYDGSRSTGYYNGGQFIWKPTTVSCECGSNVDVPITGVEAICEVGVFNLDYMWAMDDLSITEFPLVYDNMLTMSKSNNGGRTFSEPRMQSMGNLGQYNTNISFRNLGEGRNLLVRISWAGAFKTVLLGGFADIVEADITNKNK